MTYCGCNYCKEKLKEFATLLDSINERRTIDCKVCDKPMHGILSTEARDTCTRCGGMSLIVRPPREPKVAYARRTKPLQTQRIAR